MTARARLLSGEVLLGLLVTQPADLILTQAVERGYDFLFLDGEHGVFSEDDSRRAIDRARSAGTVSIVRIPGHDASDVRRTVRLGADAVLVPHVSTAAEAAALVSAMDEVRTGDEGALLLVVLESAEGAASATEIMAVAGIDGAFLGPNDLSIDLGRPRDFATPAYAAALSAIEAAVLGAGKVLGSVPHSGYPLETLRSRGHRLLVVDVDVSLVGEAMAARLSEARAPSRPS